MGNLLTKDQMGFEVLLEDKPLRIVSLVPSQTELLYDLGLGDRIVGITKFCVHPAEARKTKAIIGGTKKFDLEAIVNLQPDLIIGNKEENYPEGIAFLRERFPVWMSDITTLDDGLAMIESVSRLTGAEEKGALLTEAIRQKFRTMKKSSPFRALYLMWYDPWMGAAAGTFIDSMMGAMGLINVLAQQQRYPQLLEEDIRQLNPEVILMSSEPFPFAAKHQQQLEQQLPRAKLLFVDGEYFSWYGSRLRLAPGYFAELNNKLA